MTTLQRYVPTSSEDQLFSIPGSDELVAVRVDHFHHILLGGDQLTAARARGAQRIRANSETKVGRLKGLIPVVGDWHAKGCFLAVSYISDYCEYICNFMQLSFYVCTGDMEEVVQDFFKSRGGGGTLFQLRNLIQRTTVHADPTKDVNSSEEFLSLIAHGHVVAAAMVFFAMVKADDSPATKYIPANIDTLKSEES